MGTLSWVSQVGLMPSQGSLQIERGLVSESERFADGEKGLEPRFGRGAASRVWGRRENIPFWGLEKDRNLPALDLNS